MNEVREAGAVQTKPAWWLERAERRRAQLERAVALLPDALGAFEGVSGALVFGSYARGDVGPDSDLDLIVVRETELPRAHRDDDIRGALELGVPYDLLTVTPEQYERLSREEPFYAQARAEGCWFDAARPR